MDIKITIGIVDDHQLFLKSLSLLISSFGRFEVIVESLNGQDFLQKIKAREIHPDIALIDVDMPVMNGIDTTAQVSKYFPVVKSAALSMKDDDTSIIRMLKAGCCAYLLKDMHPDELERALVEIYSKGFYNADALNLKYRRIALNKTDTELSVSERELQFLQLACSDLTYKQIADKMGLSERTIDGYRESLFQKFKVQSRTGMVLEAIKKKLVSI